jgi:acyl-CoA thioester hydrolase
MGLYKMYQWESEVRDNEVDLQGVVNNANYFVYMAHSRHKHMKSLGIDFAKMHEDGFNLFLIHTDISFKDSLKSGDEFIVTSALKANGRIRFDFVQDVIRKSDGKIVTSAINTGVCVSITTGRPVMPEVLQKLIVSEAVLHGANSLE